MHEAKTHLSRLVERVEGGEEIVIGRAGQAGRQAGAVHGRHGRWKRDSYGAWKGRVWIADDFDDPLPPEILDAFYSESDLDR